MIANSSFLDIDRKTRHSSTLTRSQNFQTAEQVEGYSTALPIEESEILSGATIERDNDDEGASSDVTDTKKATRVVLNISSRPLSSRRRRV
jgi:hypothetical protein